MALDLGIFLEGSQSTFKVKVSENDAQAQFLLDKFTSSDGSVTITETNDGGIETIDLVAGGGISSPLTTKGDLFTYSTADARLGVGTDGQALVADSAEATGLKWGTISADNMATADLTLDANRTHDLNGNILSFELDNTNYIDFIGSGGPIPNGGRIRFTADGYYNEIKAVNGLLSLGNNATMNHLTFTNLSGDQISQFASGVTIVPTNSANRPALVVRAGTGFSGTSKVLDVQGTGGSLGFVVDANRDAYLNGGNLGLGFSDASASSRLHIKGSGATSATTTLLVENSSGTDALEIRDDSVIIMANLPTSSAGLPTGALWNNSGVINIV